MLEHPPQLNITQSGLNLHVSDYFDNLLAQRDAILERYGLTPETAEQFCDLHSTDEDREKILALYEKMVYVIEHKRIPPHLEKQEKYRLAQEIMGQDFLGIEAIEKTFHTHLNQEDIPDIQFSFEELERAKELHQFLVLRIDKIDDTPLTIEQMENILADDFGKIDGAKILKANQRQRGEYFFTTETPRLSWALVGKRIVPHSTRKNYLKQSWVVVSYLRNSVFQDTKMPEEFQSAIDELERLSDEINREMQNKDWHKAASQLEALALTKLTRHSPVEIIYDLLLYFHNTNIRLLKDVSIWTSRKSVNGNLVAVGRFDDEGVGVSDVGLNHFYVDAFGVLLSRSF